MSNLIKKIKDNFTETSNILIYTIVFVWTFKSLVYDNFTDLQIKHVVLFLLSTFLVSIKIIISYRRISSEALSLEVTTKKDTENSSQSWILKYYIPEIICIIIAAIFVFLLVALYIYGGEVSQAYTYTKLGNTLTIYAVITLMIAIIIQGFIQDTLEVFKIDPKNLEKLFKSLSIIFFIIGFSLLIYASTQIIEISG